MRLRAEGVIRRTGLAVRLIHLPAGMPLKPGAEHNAYIVYAERCDAPSLVVYQAVIIIISVKFYGARPVRIAHAHSSSARPRICAGQAQCCCCSVALLLLLAAVAAADAAPAAAVAVAAAAAV